MLRFWKECFFLITHPICFQQKPKFWFPWIILLIQSHSAANWLPLAFFKTLRFFRKKIRFPWIKSIYSFLKHQILKKAEIFNFFSRIVVQKCYLQRFLKKKTHFFSKNSSFFFNQKPNFLTFWEILQTQLHSRASLRPLAVSRILKIFSRETNIFFEKETNFWTFSEILLYQLNSTVYLLPSAIFQKNHISVSKNTFILFIKTIFRAFWEVFFFSCTLRQNSYL